MRARGVRVGVDSVRRGGSVEARVARPRGVDERVELYVPSELRARGRAVLVAHGVDISRVDVRRVRADAGGGDLVHRRRGENIVGVATGAELTRR